MNNYDLLFLIMKKVPQVIQYYFGTNQDNEDLEIFDADETKVTNGLLWLRLCKMHWNHIDRILSTIRLVLHVKDNQELLDKFQNFEESTGTLLIEKLAEND